MNQKSPSKLKRKISALFQNKKQENKPTERWKHCNLKSTVYFYFIIFILHMG